MVTRRISPSLRKNYTWRLAENHALAEFIPETSYPSRRIIHQTDNSPADSSVSTSWRRAKFISRRNVNGFFDEVPHERDWFLYFRSVSCLPRKISRQIIRQNSSSDL